VGIVVTAQRFGPGNVVVCQQLGQNDAPIVSTNNDGSYTITSMMSSIYTEMHVGQMIALRNKITKVLAE